MKSSIGPPRWRRTWTSPFRIRIIRSAGAPSSNRICPGSPTSSSPRRASHNRSSNVNPCNGTTRSIAVAISSSGVRDTGAVAAGESIRVPPGCISRISDSGFPQEPVRHRAEPSGSLVPIRPTFSSLLGTRENWMHPTHSRNQYENSNPANSRESPSSTTVKRMDCHPDPYAAFAK